MPKRRFWPDISGLLDQQHGLVHRGQVVGVAITDARLRWLLETHQWRTVLPSVYACGQGELSQEQREIAALLYSGPDGQITGAAALRRHGLRYVPVDERIQVLLPHDRRPKSAGFVTVVRTHRMDGTPVVDGLLRIASVARAVADLARRATDLRTVRAFVAEAVQRRLTTVSQLQVELEEGPRRGSALLSRVVAEVSAGVRSAPEAALRDIAEATSVLPTVLWNPRLAGADGARLPTPDGWLDEVGIAIEVDSREHHLSPEDWQRTLRRHNVFGSYGAVVLHFTPAEIYAGPEAVRRTMVEAYLERLQSGAKAAIRVLP